MPPLCVGEDGEHVLAGLSVALAHQEVALLLEQLLGLGPGNRAMIPLLLPQGFLTGGDHVEELATEKRREEKRGEERNDQTFIYKVIYYPLYLKKWVN